MNLRLVCYQTYDFIASKFFDRQVESSRSEKSDRLLTDFLIEVHKAIGLNNIDQQFLHDYVAIQFDMWRGLDKTQLIDLRTVYSKKGFARYLSKRKNINMYNVYNQEIVPAIPIVRLQHAKLELGGSSEDHYKALYHNTTRGLATCIEFTSLYDHRSKMCASCNNWTACKKVLKLQYPKIYLQRGYDI